MQSAVQAITPILLASLAGVLCGRVGVFNMALEGQMLIGAFAAIVGSYFTAERGGRRRCSDGRHDRLLADPRLWRDAVSRRCGRHLHRHEPARLGPHRLSAARDVRRQRHFQRSRHRRPLPHSHRPRCRRFRSSAGASRGRRRSPGRPGRSSPSSASCCSRPRSACGCAASANSRTRPRRSASTSPPIASSRCSSPARSPGSRARSSRSARSRVFAEDMTAGRGWIAVVAVMLGRGQSALRRGGLRAVRLRRRGRRSVCRAGPAQSTHRHRALCGDARRAGDQPSAPHARAAAPGSRRGDAGRRGRAPSGGEVISMCWNGEASDEQKR